MTIQNKTETKNRNNRMERFVKRSTDILVSVPCLVLFSPLFVIISLAIKWEDGLPIIYKQERIGLHGKPFNIYKFRSMKADAEKDGPILLEIEGDTRLTRVGKFISAPFGRTSSIVEHRKRRYVISRSPTGTEILHRPNHQA